MAGESWLRSLGFQRIKNNGVEQNFRGSVNFSGATITDNPSSDSLDIAFAGSGASFESVSISFTANGTISNGSLSDSPFINVVPTSALIARAMTRPTSNKFNTKQAFNDSNFDLTVPNEDTTGTTAADRILTDGGASKIWASKTWCTFSYDYGAASGVGRWRFRQDTLSLKTAAISVTSDGTLGIGALENRKLLTAVAVILTCPTDTTVHGCVADTVDGNMMPSKRFVNGNAPGGANISIPHDSSSVSGGAQNRWNIPTQEGGVFVLRPGESFEAPYDYTASRWAKIADADALTTGELASVLATRVGRRDRENRRVAGHGAGIEWLAGDSTAADGGVYYGTLGSGRWKRVFEGAVQAKWFGFSTSETRANNTLYLNNAIASAILLGINTVSIDGAPIPYPLNPGVIVDGSVSIVGSGVLSTDLDFGADSATPNIEFKAGGGGRVCSIKRMRIVAGGTAVAFTEATPSYFRRDTTLEDVTIEWFSRTGIDTHVEMTGCSFRNLNIAGGTVANNVLTRGLHAVGSAILHHTSWYNCRFSTTGIGIDLDYTGGLAEAGNAGVNLHQCIFENIGNDNTFPRSSVVTVSGSANITVPSTTDLVAGMSVSGSGLASDAYITKISGTTVTLNRPATASATISVIFYPGIAIRIHSSSVYAYACYFEGNASNDVVAGTDYAGGAVTKARVNMYHPTFDPGYFNDSIARQLSPDSVGYRRIAIVNEWVQFSIHHAKVDQTSGRKLDIDVGEHIYGRYNLVHSPDARTTNDQHVFGVSDDHAGIRRTGYFPCDGGSGVTVDTGIAVLGSYWGGAIRAVATKRTGGPGTYVTHLAEYLIGRIPFDGVGSIQVLYRGGTSDFMSFTAPDTTLVAKAADDSPFALQIVSM